MSQWKIDTRRLIEEFESVLLWEECIPIELTKNLKYDLLRLARFEYKDQSFDGEPVEVLGAWEREVLDGSCETCYYEQTCLFYVVRDNLNNEVVLEEDGDLGTIIYNIVKYLED